MKTFIQAAAICSLVGALTTALLMWLPRPAAADFEAQAALSGSSLYLTHLWILFLHPQVNILASFGVAFVLFKKYPLAISFGTFFLVVWAVTEMTQQSLLIDALNQIWRPGYLDATEDVARSRFETLIQAAGGISDSYYFLVIYGFGLGSLLYGVAFVREANPTKWIGVALWFIGVLTLASFARYYLGFVGLNEMVDGAYRWIYSWLQPAVRIALGVWLLGVAKSYAH